MSAAICIYPECVDKRYSRGLCLRHYGIARNLVRAGKIGWEAMENNKRALPIGKRCSTTNEQKWFLNENPDSM